MVDCVKSLEFSKHAHFHHEIGVQVAPECTSFVVATDDVLLFRRAVQELQQTISHSR